MVALCIIAGVVLLIAIVLCSLKAILEALLWILGITVVLCLIVFLLKVLFKMLGH